MTTKILYTRKFDEENSLTIKIEDGRLIEREKLDGRYKRERLVDAGEAGSRIARQAVKNTDGVWTLPGELINALGARVHGRARVYWACYLAQAIHMMVAPRHVIVDYAEYRRDLASTGVDRGEMAYVIR